MRTGLSRRVVLRGLFQGATVAVALPYLDCFLNSNETALAAGAPLPVRFGTWFWGLGVTPGRWHPTTVGRDYDLPPELTPIAAQKDKITIFSGFDCLTDGKPNFPHATAGPAFRTGIAPSSSGVLHGPSFDTIVANEIGNDTRFRSLDVSAIGDRTNTLSGQGVGQMNPTESSALAFYQRIFGEGFTDPNAATFTPDPIKMARKSALSIVKDQRRALEQQLGTADRARIDQYFTSLRQVESQLALQLQKPEPLVACQVPAGPENKEVANDLEDVTQTHEVMTRLLAMALACNQTKVFNMELQQRRLVVDTARERDVASSAYPRRADRPGAGLSAGVDEVHRGHHEGVGDLRQCARRYAGRRWDAARSHADRGPLRNGVCEATQHQQPPYHVRRASGRPYPLRTARGGQQRSGVERGPHGHAGDGCRPRQFRRRGDADEEDDRRDRGLTTEAEQ